MDNHRAEVAPYNNLPKTPLSDSEYYNRKLMLETDTQPVAPPPIFRRHYAPMEGLTRELFDYFYSLAPKHPPEFAMEDFRAICAAETFVFGDAANYTYDLDNYDTSMELPYPECAFEFEDRNKKAILYVKQHRVKNAMYNNGAPVIMCKLFFKESDGAPWEFRNFLYRIQMSGGVILARMMIDMDKPRHADMPSTERRRWVGLFDRYSTALLALLHGLANKKVVIVRPSGNLHVAGDEKTEDGTSVVWMSGVIKRTTEHLGGTHASPREHERMAHDRTLASGKTIRIPALTINKGVKGKISKTYRIKKDVTK